MTSSDGSDDVGSDPLGSPKVPGASGTCLIRALIGLGLSLLLFTALLHVLAGFAFAWRTTFGILLYWGLPALELVVAFGLLLARKVPSAAVAIALFDLLNIALIVNGSLGLI